MVAKVVPWFRKEGEVALVGQLWGALVSDQIPENTNVCLDIIDAILKEAEVTGTGKVALCEYWVIVI